MYDWMKVYANVEALELDLPEFKWKGDGWYHTPEDTLLAETLDDGRIRAQVWNTPQAQKLLAELLSRPVVSCV